MRDGTIRTARRSRRHILKLSGLAAGTLLGWYAVDRARAATPAYLRPPGAGTPEEFLAACIRCGQCVEACPTEVLHLAHAAAGVGLGTPYLIARDRPCDLCLGRPQMECIGVCPTAALKPVADREDVRMGTAVIDPATCFPWIGVTCRACWHACPMPDVAIVIGPLARPRVVADGCVGCGLCEYACPTPQPAIQVRPRSH